MPHAPRVTVAAVIERGGRFLLVEERIDRELRLNQPAGHWEPGESLPEAAARETLEETGFTFAPARLVGIYEWHAASGDAYLRFAFAGPAREPPSTPRLDHEIVRTLWLSRDELAACRERHRGPQVLACVEDYLAGASHPLELLHRLSAETPNRRE